jgi:hypothetical protein
MSESTLEELKRETKERELKKKVATFRREQVEKEIVEEIRLTGGIYVKPLASHAPTTKGTRIFEQEQKSRKLEEELEATLNFF